MKNMNLPIGNMDGRGGAELGLVYNPTSSARPEQVHLLWRGSQQLLPPQVASIPCSFSWKKDAEQARAKLKAMKNHLALHWNIKPNS